MAATLLSSYLKKKCITTSTKPKIALTRPRITVTKRYCPNPYGRSFLRPSQKALRLLKLSADAERLAMCVM